MMIKRFPLLLLLACLMWLPAGVAAQSDAPPVRAVLFFSPTCPHCHLVMNEVLPPLQAQYGEQLEILEIDVSQEAGTNLYQNYLIQYQIGDQRRGVPALVVGDTVLVGSQEIPDIFPGIIAANLENGIDWPEISGLETILDGANPESTNEASATSLNSGLWLAWIGMLFLFAVLVIAAWRVGGNPHLQVSSPAGWVYWLVPALALLGLFISAYLTIVELGQTAAVCGPVGDCNAVQSSSYATIGPIPVALLGLFFYLAVAGLWLALPRLKVVQQRPAAGVLLAATTLGIIFSVYLTSVEIFILEAVCAWCITSAVISALLFLVVVLVFFPGAARKRRKTGPARRHVAH